MGDLWGPSPERGCFKTSDGGRSWRKVLGAPAPHDVRVGCGDLALDPKDPNVVYAALYARQRKPWAFDYGVAVTNGADVGGIFRSADGGATWTKQTNGLPTLTGRIGLSVHARDPRIVYAIVQSDEGGTSNIDQPLQKKGGVFRTEDGGQRWTRMNALDPRPFYFSQIRVDPQDAQKVWVLGFALHVSEDGGRTFREDRFKQVHADNHALAFDPADPRRVVLGTDGGVYQSYDAGARWAHQASFAGGQFYRVNVDMQRPYRICGGLQDNLNWVGPSRTQSKEGITNAAWTNIGGGDGFYCVFDPDSSDLVYAESQSGYVHRTHLKTGEIRQLRPEPTEGQPAYRFHWNSPLVASRHVRGTMYLAGNRVFRLTDRGESWRAISPDLSSRNVDRILATGSGRGDVRRGLRARRVAAQGWDALGRHRRRQALADRGWRDELAGSQRVAAGRGARRVDPAHRGLARDASTAYLVVDAHRSQKLAPYVYRTDDMGRSWRSVAANLPADAPAKVLREHPRNPNLLFLGTESGLWASLDRGRHWSRFGNLPPVAVDDLVLHPRANDLVVATHGRSIYVVDDVTALERLTPAVRATAVHLFPIPPADGAICSTAGTRASAAPTSAARTRRSAPRSPSGCARRRPRR
jgi:photosystem II stability/assembly factor-like uncharacterized protein